MSELVVVSFDDKFKAEEVLLSLLKQEQKQEQKQVLQSSV
jgi:uncharacterized membrane protein